MGMIDTSKLCAGLETAFVDENVTSSPAFRPTFVSNDRGKGKKVLSTIEDELLSCEQFQISVAFVTMSGITPLLQTFRELEERNIPGQILTTNYLCFSEPSALEKLHGFKNITLKMYDVDSAGEGFHTKGYIFRNDQIYRIIIGSANMTSAALTSNREWNTRIVSTERGEMAKQILDEYNAIWNSPNALPYDIFAETYFDHYDIVKHQREIAKQEHPISLEKYKLEPNSMQVSFIANLKKILEENEDRALLISATGTGKTYASAFAMREIGFKRVLFLVHRGQLAKQTLKSYRNVFGQTVTMGLVGAGYSEYDRDYVFATIQTLNKETHMRHYRPDEFDCIILDEAHHSSADSYQKVMRYFKPRLWLGMTATPDKRDDNEAGKNIYEIFNYQIAYEIRLQQAMEDSLLCPFHYFGISDLSMVGDAIHKSKKLSIKDFKYLTSDERVQHIIQQAEFYGYSGDRVKGLIFCSSIRESRELSYKFNQMYKRAEDGTLTNQKYRTVALDGDSGEEERELAFERLAMDEADATPDKQPLDYIFSVEILNEGVDIVEVNQVIMLRPTESPIVFIQQLGRGLRKNDGKEYVVVLDFIGNYEKNFMIPVALSGDRSYNADTIRKYVISGNRVIPGASTVHFDAIAKDKIFQSIDRIKGMKALIRESYQNLKARLGRVAYLEDFYDNQEVDPLVIISEYKTYHSFLSTVEGGQYLTALDDHEKLIIEYLSKTILSGVRPYELEVLKELMAKRRIFLGDLRTRLRNTYGDFCNEKSLKDAIQVLQGHFVSKDEEYQKYRKIDLLQEDGTGYIVRTDSMSACLDNAEFKRQLMDLVAVGLKRHHDKYSKSNSENPFVLYEKYSRRDVSLLMNCGKDMSSTMYGMKKIDNDVFIFITYHKVEAEDESKQYAEGKPDYADAFADSVTFHWDSQIGRGPDSSYMHDVVDTPHKHLLVKKSDVETNFYYMGTFDVVEVEGSTKLNNRGVSQPITKVTMKMHSPVREDLLKYLESSITHEEGK